MKGKLKCVVALLLCMTMVFGTNLSTLADTNTAVPQTVQVQETEKTAQESEAAQTTEEQQQTQTQETQEMSSGETQTQQETQTEETQEEQTVQEEEKTEQGTAQTPESQGGTKAQTGEKESAEVKEETAETRQSGNTLENNEGETENEVAETRDFNSLDSAELYDLLRETDNNTTYLKIWNSLSEAKKEELAKYTEEVTAGETQTYDSTDKIVSSLDAAPVLEKKDSKKTTSKKAKTSESSDEAFNKTEETADGLEISKSLADYDAETGEGLLSLEAYVTGQITSSTTTEPVDVVLVLDQSGSMEDKFGESGYVIQNYTNAQAESNQNSLYVNYEGRYQRVRITHTTESEETITIDNNVTFEELYNSIEYRGNDYYFNFNDQEYEIKISRELIRNGWDRYWQYTITIPRVPEVTIATGRENDAINSHMSDGMEGSIYYKNPRIKYTYSLNDGREIGTSYDANGIPPQTLFRYVSGYGQDEVSNLEALQAAASNFVDSIRNNAIETGADHRIAVVGFASGNSKDMSGFQGSAYQNTELFIGENQYSYGGSAINQQYRRAFQDVSTSTGIENLKDSISVLGANGGTWPEYGIDMANKIFANNSNINEDNTERKRVVVIFSDGEPGNSDQSRPSRAYNDAIGNVYTTKNTYGASVYSIGIFNGANGNVVYSRNAREPRPESFTNSRANKFMHLISSNYPTAQNMNAGIATISKNLPLKDENDTSQGYESYYLSAANADELNSVFDSIYQEIGSADIDLDETTVLQDVMSQYFDVNPDSTEDIRVLTSTTNDNGRTWDSPVDITSDVEITSENGRIKVSGFNYSDNYVAENHAGKKLTVQIPIQYKFEQSFGGNNIPTNDVVSGIYDSTGETCFGNFESPKVNQPIRYQIGTQSKTIYLTNNAELSDLMTYVEGYKADGIKNQFVSITYTLKKEGQVYGTLGIDAGQNADNSQWAWNQNAIASGLVSENGIVEPTNCQEFELVCVVTPKDAGDDQLPGELARESTYASGTEDNPQNPWIHVLKPTIKAKDHFIFLGDSENFKNIWEENGWSDFEDHTEIPSVEGQAPQITIDKTNLELVEGTELPDEGDYYPKKDSNFEITSVQIGGEVFQETNRDFKVEPCTKTEHEDCYINSSDEENHDFTVHVIAGEIDITKILENANDGNNTPEGDPIFTFKIEKLGTGDKVDKVWYRTIRFDEKNLSRGENREEAELLNGLEKGRYRITELTTQKYSFSGVTGTITEDTNYTSDITGRAITFKIGNRINGSENKFARTIRAEFTNKKTGPSTNTDTDVVVNRFVKENGEWTIKQIRNPGQDQRLTDPTGSNMNDNK